ncbi:glutamyl-tRNA reductase [Glaciecola petra]|uniref:Glutamyl-tRNA reductase n=1 Tax=Glaciecola petra TaxID=3075602 RepID=A0ABU2ZMZ7_9ALTE|nr:glutamyl-tRNA reductase [Aestuariibacter sp. P117]MDT0594002.1 glutamyl-tRNA reductase [Aestuariibacter sp. P117]
MSFIAVGINHETAPVEVREKVAFTPATLADALTIYAKQRENAELVILSTCNRTELFASSAQISCADLIDWLAELHSINVETLKKYIYLYEKEDALRHLMEVACGLNSLILGEPQIFGQVKQAFTEAKHVGTINGQFEKIFQSTFSVAKKVRTQTDIGANAVSVAYAAVQLAKQIFGHLNKSTVLLIGAGETIELVAKHLSDVEIKQVTIANRTLANAQHLADVLDIQSKVVTISQIPSVLSETDIVISSTASALPLISKGTIDVALKARRHKPMLLIDLAVPRDIEDQVSKLDDAYLYTVDDLQHIVQENIANREVAASEANAIISQNIEDLLKWQQLHQKRDLIKAYREDVEIVRQQILSKAMQKLAQGEETDKVLEELSYKLAQTMMHQPTKALQQAIADPNKSALSLLEDIFTSQVEGPKGK